MRRATALLAAGLLTLAAAAGCGGGEELAPLAPGPPAEMPLPEASDPTGGGDEEADEPADETEPDAETDTGTGTEPATEDPLVEPGATEEVPAAPAPEETGAVAPAEPEPAVPEEEEVGGGAAAPEAAPDGPTNDTPPPAGSNAERFEDFCAQNPGAC
jgi:hypothetical protein